MMDGWDMNGWGWGWMTLMMIIGVALVTLIIVLLLRGPGIGTQTQRDPNPNHAADLLDERLARGEINEDEYRQLRNVLKTRKE